eukprot:123780_1
MYDEHLGNDKYGAFSGSAPAAPAAFSVQNDFDIEMNRYRAASAMNYDDYQGDANGAGGGAVAGGFGDAVYLGDDDANSDHGHNKHELNINKELPDMNKPFGHLAHARSGSIRDLDSPRDQWAANPDAPDPTKGLTCLWCILVAVILACIAAGTTIDHSMIQIVINMSAEGNYGWNLGWRDASFFWWDDAIEGQSLSYGSAASAEPEFPIPNTMVYMGDAGNLLLSTILVSLATVAYILMILCSRCNTHILLYINCCCCRIPQRASVHFAFDIIKTFSWATSLFYIVLGIYGFLETNVYLTRACPSGNTCWAYIAPHYGFMCLMMITFSISCCAFSKVQALDVKFNIRSMQLYYPENLRKAESRNCNIKLEMLFNAISATKNIIIVSFIMFVAFRDVGMVSTVLFDKTESVGTNIVMFFLFNGLTNSEYNEIGELLYVDTSNSQSGVTYTTLEPNYTHEEYLKDVGGFVTIAQLLNWWILLILVINLCIFLPYIWSVILRYSSIGCFKFIMVLFTFIECLVYTILVALYYYEFYAFFHNVSQLKLQYQMEQLTGNDWSVNFFPDWGLFLAGILWFYLVRLMYTVFKAM